MPASNVLDRFLPYLALALFFAASMMLRPVLPVDETRYLTVAWEMYLRSNFFVPTLNFAPYFQKPPLLFWLIDIAWYLLGPTRAGAMVVIFAISSTVIYLTQRLADGLFPASKDMTARIPWLVLGCVIFSLYAGIILFDLLLTVFVIATMLALLAFSKHGAVRYATLAGLMIGFGVLAKGPVVLIHVACPLALYPLWRDPRSSIPARRFYAQLPLMIGMGFVPVILWLGPALFATGLDFAYNLIWRQAAGRVSGSLESAHARPFYFYLLMLPVVLFPWVLSIDFWRLKPWRQLRERMDGEPQDRRVLRFLLIWCVVVFFVFSLISGKQPHYLVPLLPPIALLIGYLFARMPIVGIRFVAVATLAVLCVVQIALSFTVFPRYDLGKLSRFIGERRDADWAYVERYQGQVTFLSRLEKPFEIIRREDIDTWFASHPGGYVLWNIKQMPNDPTRVVFSQPFEREHMMVLHAPE